MRPNRSLLVVAILVVGCAQQALASRFNVLPGRTGGPANGGSTCRSCHGNTVGGGSVEIIGAPDNYMANTVYDITVRVSDATKLGAGFQISVEDGGGNHIGALSVIDAVNTKHNDDDPVYVNHTSTGVDNSVANWAANGNSVDYTIRWTAPSTDMGTITFWAAGNAINNNFSSGGDLIYTTSKTANFIAVPAASTWGLVVLGLTVLTAGSLLQIRRKSQPALAPAR